MADEAYRPTSERGERIIRLRAVLDYTGLSRSGLYELIQQGDFPAPVRLSARASGWLESEVEEWIQSRPRAMGDNEG